MTNQPVTLVTDDALPVTLVTQNATHDSLSDADYRAIITGLREINGWSYQRLADEAGHNGKAWWQMVEVGKRAIDEQGRNALRRLTDGELPPQPPSVTAVTEAMIDADAAMWLVGTLEPGERVRRVLMLAASDVAVYVNGTVSAEPLQAATTGVGASECHNDTLHAVTGAVRSVGANREPCYRPKFSVEDRERFESLGGLRRIIDAGMKALQEDGR